MGLDAGFLAMLEATVVVERKTGRDKWGNETYDAPTTERTFIGPITTNYGDGEMGKQQEKKSVRSTELIMDSVGVTLESRLTFGGGTWYVSQVETVNDELGNDLYQNVTVEDQKKG